MSSKRGSSQLKDVGARLAIARKKLGLSQAQFGKLCGIGQAQLSKFETGERGLETEKLLQLLAVAAEHGINVQGYLLRGIGVAVHSDLALLADDSRVKGLAEEIARKIIERRGA